jgi:hypothetical protein
VWRCTALLRLLRYTVYSTSAYFSLLADQHDYIYSKARQLQDRVDGKVAQMRAERDESTDLTMERSR